jgi:hypothetical protein
MAFLAFEWLPAMDRLPELALAMLDIIPPE